MKQIQRGDDNSSLHSPDDKNVCNSPPRIDSIFDGYVGSFELWNTFFIFVPWPKLKWLVFLKFIIYERVILGKLWDTYWENLAEKTMDFSETFTKFPYQKIIHIWNEVLESPMFQNKTLLYFFFLWNQINSLLLVFYYSRLFWRSNVVVSGMEPTNVAIKMLLEKDLTAEEMEDFCNGIFILRYMSFNLFFVTSTYLLTFHFYTEYFPI